MKKLGLCVAGLALLLPHSAEAQMLKDDSPWCCKPVHPLDKEVGGFYFNLGPTGIRARIYQEAMTHLRVMYVYQDAKSPARGKVKKGDVIVGANGKMFTIAHRFGRRGANKGWDGPLMELSKHIEYSQGKDGDLDLIIWPGGKKSEQKIVTIKIEAKGEFSPTYPWNCVRSQKMLGELCDFLANEYRTRGFGGGPHVRAQSTLALMASGIRKHEGIVKDVVSGMARGKYSWESGGFCNWNFGFSGVVMGEWYLRTGDKSVLPALKQLAVDTYPLTRIGGDGAHFTHRSFPVIRRLGKKPYASMAAISGLIMIAMSLCKEARLPYDQDTYLDIHQAYLDSATPDSMNIAYAFGSSNKAKPPAGYDMRHAIIKLKDPSRAKSGRGVGFKCPTGMKDIGEWELVWPTKADHRWKPTDWITKEAKYNLVEELAGAERRIDRNHPLCHPKPTGEFRRPLNVTREQMHLAPIGMGAPAHFIGNRGNRGWEILGQLSADTCGISPEHFQSGHASSNLHAFWSVVGASWAEKKKQREYLEYFKSFLILSEAHNGGMVMQPWQRDLRGIVSDGGAWRRLPTGVAIMALSMPGKRLMINGAPSKRDTVINPLYDIQADGFRVIYCQKEAQRIGEGGAFNAALKSLDKAAGKDDDRGKEAKVFAERLRQWITKYTEALIERSHKRPAKSSLELDDYVKRVRGLEEEDAVAARRKELKEVDGIKSLVAAYKNRDKIAEYERTHGTSRQTESGTTKLVKKLEDLIADEDTDEALRAEAKLLLSEVKGEPAASDSSPGITIEGPTAASGAGGATPTTGPTTATAPRPAPGTRKADAETIARYDAKLVERIKVAVAGGKRPRFVLASLNCQVQIQAAESDKVLLVETLDPPMQFRIEWVKLTLANRKDVALGVLSEGDEEGHALAAFYAFACKDTKTARSHLQKAGQAGDEVRSVFE